MANNQPHSSLFVVPSDTINIPQPGILTSGTQNSTSGTAVLTDASQDFTTSVTNDNGYNVRGGILYQAYTGAFPGSVNVIVNISAPTELKTANNTTAAAVGNPYNVCSSDLDGKTSFTLFVGSGGAATTLRVLTAAGDDVTLTNVPDSSFIPLQVVRVFATGTNCSEILALY